MTELKPGKYRIKGSSKYFKDKYGTSNPEFELEADSRKLWPGGWGMAQGNPAALLYAMRSAFDGIGMGGTVYYGHVGPMGELAHESELEPIESGQSNGASDDRS